MKVFEFACIYALIDPRDKNIFYVGRSINPKQRFQEHVISSARQENRGFENAKTWQINQIVAAGLKPELKILRELTNVDEFLLADIEKRFIEDYDRFYFLTNRACRGWWRIGAIRRGAILPTDVLAELTEIDEKQPVTAA